ncbi:MAG: hypothetical protein AAF985_12355 [Bacteroidota bacterium]
MKTPSDDLFRLIQSMTASEKRYLKLHYCSSKSCLTELFNYLNGLDEYNEQQVKKYFANSNRKLSKNLKVYKVQLVELILKGLTSFHAKKKLSSQVRQGLEEVEILMGKSLFDLANSRLKKLYKLCESHQLHQLALSVLEQRMYIDQLQNGEDQLLIFNAIGHHLACIRWKLKLQQVELDLQGQLLSSTHQGKNKEHLSKLNYYCEVMEQKDPAADRGGLISFLQEKIKTDLTYCLHGDVEEHFQMKKELVDHFDGFPRLNHPDFYRWQVMTELLQICEQQGRFAYMLDVISQMKALQAKSIYPFDLSTAYLAEIKYWYQSRQYRALDRLFEAGILEQLDANGQRKPMIIKQCLLFYVLHFMVHRQDQKAQQLLIKIYGEYKDKEKRMEPIVNIIELIHHYESKDNTVLHYFLKAFQRRARRSNRLGPFFLFFIKFIKQLSKTDQGHQATLAIAFQKQMVNFCEDPLYQSWNYFYVSDWIAALISGNTFSEYRLKLFKQQQEESRKTGVQA